MNSLFLDAIFPVEKPKFHLNFACCLIKYMMLKGQGENKHLNTAKNKKCGLQRVSDICYFLLYFSLLSVVGFSAASEENVLATDTKQII